MAIFECTGCGFTKEFPDVNVGKKGICPSCNRTAVVRAIAPPVVEPEPIEEFEPLPPHPVLQPSPIEPAAKPQSPSAASAVPPWFAVCLLAVIAACQVCNVAMTTVTFLGGQSSIPVATRWEYMIDAPGDLSFEDAMKTHGRRGWELVSARRATGSGSGASYEMIFRRPMR